MSQRMRTPKAKDYTRGERERGHGGVENFSSTRKSATVMQGDASMS